MPIYQFKITEDPLEERLREELLLETVGQFCPRLKDRPLSICRTEKGKPYLVDETTGQPLKDLRFSISHSGDKWACVISHGTCGLDLQELRPVPYEKLAERYFYPEEARYIKEAGLRGFYQLWVRREALAKYTGLGFFGMFSERPLLVDVQGNPAGSVIWDGKTIVFEEMDAPKGFMAIWCWEEKAEDKGDSL